MDATGVTMIVIIIVTVGIAVCGRLAQHWLTSPKTIHVVGQLPDVEEWLPHAMRRTTGGFYSTRWGAQTMIFSDQNGRATKYLGVLLGNQGDYKIEAELPAYTPGTTFTEHQPLLISITLITYLYPSSRLRWLFLGRYPDNVAVAARCRVIRVLKRHARRAVRELSHRGEASGDAGATGAAWR